MTTIAYRDGVLAGDSCWADDKLIDTYSKKIRRLRSGALLGEAGTFDIRPMVNMLQSVKHPRSLPSYEALLALRCDFLGLIVFPSGRMFKIETTIEKPEEPETEVHPGLWEIEGPFTAIGSGKTFAIGAMEAGAGARRAVQIACRRDPNTRAPVHTLYLNPGRKNAP